VVVTTGDEIEGGASLVVAAVGAAPIVPLRESSSWA